MNMTIYLNNGLQFSAVIENFNAAEFTQTQNNPNTAFVCIGNIVLNKHAVMMILPTELVGEEA